jgi:PAS domain S-box-containing protein
MRELTAEDVLRESEELHRLALRCVSDVVIVTTDDGLITFVGPNVDVVCDCREDDVRGLRHISQLLGGDLLEANHLPRTGETRTIEHEVTARDGTRHVWRIDVRRIAIRCGTIMYVCRDITERMRAEGVVRDLGARLIEARERERRRLSVEVHDNLGQQVALLSAELVMLRHGLEGSPVDLDHVDRILAQTADLGTELHRLSHDLHPAPLEQAGLFESVRRVCADLSRAYGLPIDLETLETPAGLGSDTALCLYRIVQEALSNVVKHSGAASASVRVETDNREIVLTVVDDGRGFDLRAEAARTGIGLISMQDRARQLNGYVVVRSRPGMGTEVRVRLPRAGSTTGERGLQGQPPLSDAAISHLSPRHH